MLDFVTKATNTFDENVKAVGVSLDLQKAFDCLNYKILFNIIDFNSLGSLTLIVSLDTSRLCIKLSIA